MAKKGRKAARRAAALAGQKASQDERYREAAKLDVPPGNLHRMVELCALSHRAWDFAIAHPHPQDGDWTMARGFAALPNGPRDGLDRQVVHAAIRSARQTRYMGDKAYRKEHGDFTFQVGARVAYLDSLGLCIGNLQPIALSDASWAPSDFIGAPYIVSVRISWTIDGWRADFMLRDDPDDALKLKALKRGA